jgi:sugar porter (SP) family MFS transporter
MLLAARFLGGFAVGAASVLGPVYIAELSPAQWRGRLVGMFQINVVTGIVIGFCSNYLVHLAGLGENEWRVMAGLGVLPAVAFLLLLFGIPHSPRWLASFGRNEEALEVLGQVGAPNPTAELAQIQAAIRSAHVVEHEPVLRWKYRYPLFLAISIGAFNQLTGINAILANQVTIFSAAGFGQLSSFAQAIAIGVTNLVFTLVGMSMIDKFGRKSLLVTGAIGTAACLSGVAWIFATNSHQSALLALLAAFIAFFALSQGLVVFVYIGEVFPNAVRAKGQGVGNAALSAMNTAILFSFPVLAHEFSKQTPFIFFAAATVLQLVVVSFFYPETKGRTLEELQSKLVKVG